MAGGMVGFPTPAGHQSDLNYIMQMVEELSAQLAQNQGLTAGIVEKMGKVRAKAQNLDLSNDELLALAASELNGNYYFFFTLRSTKLTPLKSPLKILRRKTQISGKHWKSLCSKRRRTGSSQSTALISFPTFSTRCTNLRASMRQTPWRGIETTESSWLMSVRRTSNSATKSMI